MYHIKKVMIFVWVLILAACAVNSLDFDNLNYPVTTKKVIGKLVLIVPTAAIQKQITVPAQVLNTTNDQTVSVGQMLVKVADYEYPKIFSSYQRVTAMSDISPGFYRAIIELNVADFTVNKQEVFVSLHTNIYSYQGKLLYEKSFIATVKMTTTLQAAALAAYRNAMQQVNDRLEQLLYWEDHADAKNNHNQALETK